MRPLPEFISKFKPGEQVRILRVRWPRWARMQWGDKAVITRVTSNISNRPLYFVRPAILPKDTELGVVGVYDNGPLLESEIEAIV